MSWLFMLALITGTADRDDSHAESESNDAVNKADTKASTGMQPEASIELLLFLAEWNDDDNDQWLDPEIFATEDDMNLQLDIKKVKKNETDPDHN